MTDKYQEQLTQSIRKGSAILWIGPDPFRSHGFPSEEVFLKKIITYFRKTIDLDPQKLGMLERYFSQEDWPRAAKFCMESQPEIYARSIRQYFKTDVSPDEIPILHALRVWSKMGLKQIITANIAPHYSTLFQLPPLTWLDSPLLPAFAEGNREGLLYLKGSAESPETLTFSLDQKKQYEGEQGELLRENLRLILAKRDLWLTGFQAEDLDLIQKLAQQKENLSSAARILLPRESTIDLPPWLEPVYFDDDPLKDGNLDPDMGLANWLEPVARELKIVLPAFSGPLPEDKTPEWYRWDFSQIKNLDPLTPEEIEAYYRGKQPSMALIRDGFTIRRQKTDEVLKEIEAGASVLLIDGPSCEGKSTVLKQVGLELLGQGYTLFEATGPKSHVRRLLQREKGRLVILLDNAVQYYGLSNSIKEIKERNDGSILLMAARSHEWQHLYGGGDLITRSVPKITLKPLSRSEADSLAEKLKNLNLIQENQQDTGEQIRHASKKERFLLAAMLEVLDGKPFGEVLSDVLKEISGWLNGKPLLKAISLAVAIETLPTRSGNPFHCSQALFREVIGLGNRSIDDFCQKLVGEVQLQTKMANEIGTRDPIIAKALYPILFDGKEPYLDLLELYSEIIESAGRLAYGAGKKWEKILLTIIPRHLWKAKKEKEALILLETASKIFPGHAPIWHMWAGYAAKQGNIGDSNSPYSARWLYKRAVEVDPKNVPSWQAWAIAEANQGNIGAINQPESARWLFHKATEVDPNHVPAWQAWAIAEANQGNIGAINQPESARWLFHKATEVDPNHVPAWQAWAIAEARAGNPGDMNLEHSATWLFAYAANLNPQDPAIWSAWVEFESWLGNHEQAEKLVKFALKYCPRDHILNAYLKIISNGKKIPNTEKFGQIDLLTPKEKEEKHTPRQASKSEYEAYLNANELLKNASAFDENRIIRALAEIAPLTRKKILRDPEMGRVSSNPAVLLALPPGEHPETKGSNDSMVFVATLDGGLYFFKVLADPYSKDGYKNFKLKKLFAIPDFNSASDHILGLYWGQATMSSYPNLFLAFRRKGIVAAYQYALDPQNDKPVLLNEIKDWMKICPVGTSPETILFGEKIEVIPQNEAQCAAWLKQQLISCSPVMDRCDLKANFICVLENTVLSINRDQNIVALEKEDGTWKRVWRWFSRRQPVCICPLTPIGGRQRFIVGYETGDLTVANVMPPKWADSIWDGLSNTVAEKMNLNSSGDWFKWVKEKIIDQESLRPRDLVAVFKLLFNYILKDPKFAGKNHPEWSKLLRNGLNSHDYLPLTSSIRQTIKSWEKENSQLLGVEAVHLLYHSMNYRQRDTIDADLQRHAIMANNLPSINIQDEDKKNFYCSLMERKNRTRTQLLLDTATDPRDKACIHTEAWLGYCWLEYTTRWEAGREGYLRCFPKSPFFYWVGQESIIRLDAKNNNNVKLTPLNWSTPGMCIVLTGENSSGLLAVSNNKLTYARLNESMVFDGKEPWVLGEEISLLKVADTGSGWAFLLVRTNTGQLELHLVDPESNTSLASVDFAFEEPQEWVFGNSEPGKRWIGACDGQGGVVVFEISFEKGKLIFVQRSCRPLQDGIRSLALAPHEQENYDLLVGTTRGNLFAYNLGRNNDLMNLRWMHSGCSAIRHLDWVNTKKGYHVFAMTAFGEMWIVNQWGRLKSKRQMHTTFRSGAILKIEGMEKDQIFAGIVDVWGIFYLMAQQDPRSHKEKAFALIDQVQGDTDSPHDELDALRLIQKKDLVVSDLKRQWSAKARDCLAKGLTEAYYDPTSFDSLNVFLEEVSSLFKISDLEIIAHIKHGKETLEKRRILTPVLIKAFVNFCKRNPQGSSHGDRLVRLLCDLIRGTGREIIKPRWVHQNNQLWSEIPEVYRKNPTVNAAILRNIESFELAPEKLQDMFCQIIGEATFLEPEGFAALEYLAPLNKVEMVSALYHAIFSIENDDKADVSIIRKLEYLDLTGNVQTFVALIRFLLNESENWQTLVEMANYIGRSQDQATEKLSIHPKIKNVFTLLKDFRLEPDHELRPIEEQLEKLNKIAHMALPKLGQEIESNKSWSKNVRKLFVSRCDQVIKKRREELQSLFRVRLENIKAKLDTEESINLSFDLKHEGYKQGDPEIELQLEYETNSSASTQIHFSKLRYLPPNFNLNIPLHDTAKMSIRVITSLEDGYINEDIWPIPLLVGKQNDFLNSLPNAVTMILDNLKEKPHGVYILAYDSDLGYSNLIQQLENNLHLHSIQLDNRVRQDINDHKNQPVIDAERILKNLGAKFENDRWSLLEDNFQGVLITNAQEMVGHILGQTPVLDNFKKYSFQIKNTRVFWLLPLELAFSFQVQTGFEFVPLYRLPGLESETSSDLVHWLFQEKGLSANEARAILNKLDGNLRLLHAWLDEGSSIEEFLKSERVNELLLQEMQGMSLEDYANLITLAFSRTGLGKELLIPGAQPVERPEIISPSETESTGGLGVEPKSWIKGYFVDKDSAWIPEQIKALKLLGRAAEFPKRDRCRKIFEQRGVLTRGEFIFLNYPYQIWLEYNTDLQTYGQDMISRLSCKPVSDLISLYGMMAAKSNLANLKINLSPNAEALLSLFVAYLYEPENLDALGQIAYLMTGFSPLPVAQIINQKVPNWRSNLIDGLQNYLGSSNLFIVKNSSKKETWLGFSSEIIEQDLHYIIQIMEKYKKNVTLVLMGPGLNREVSINESPNCFVLLLDQVKEMVLSTKPERTFWAILGARFGLLQHSPFQVGNALEENSPVFVGREREIKFITANIDNRSFLILGGRQIGKTSLLKHLYSILKSREDYTPIYLNCEGVYTVEDFWSKLQIALKPRKYITSDQGSIYDLIERALRSLPKPVLLLNEVDGLAFLAHNLLKRLRNLSEDRICQCIMVGYHGSYGGTKAIAHPFFHWVTSLDGEKALILGQLSKQAAAELIQKLEDSPLCLSWENEETREIGVNHLIEQSYRIPILLQGSLQALVQHLDMTGRVRITRQDLERDRERGRPVWDYLQKIRVTITVSQYEELKNEYSEGKNLSSLSASIPDVEELYWNRLVLASICRKFYFTQENNLINLDFKDENDFRNNLCFSLVDVLCSVDECISAEVGLKHIIYERFKPVAYQKLLDLWTLTVLLSPMNEKYFFRDHIYPKELYLYLTSIDMNLDQYILDQISVLKQILCKEVL